MMPSWTKEQNDAIYITGKNIIVSAGAGSGKTAVLSERVLKKVLNGVSVDRLLILTFTKAAASEMKKRIRDKIKENHLSMQLNKIDNSYITTFDSFSLSLVRKYHYLLNVKQNIKIIEKNILDIKIRKYLDEIMEEEYQRKDNNFTKLIEDFCVKDDQELKKTLLSLNEKLNMKYDKKEYLDSYLEYFYQDEIINKNFIKYENLLLDKVHEFDLCLSQIADVVSCEYFSKLKDLSHDLVCSTNYDEVKTSSSKITKLPMLPRGSDDYAKELKEHLKNILDEIKELTKVDNKENLLQQVRETKPYLMAIINIYHQLDDKISKYKQENDLYDFVDISKMAIKIVKENKDIQKEIQEYFEEILVDEYQDTSDLQEEFIQLISNNNLYMVGDVKQSIYRFRNANPNIFREKYNTYAQNINGIKIDLLKNFRSREEVLDNINLIFDFIMNEEIGGADYKKEHRMVFGNTSYNIEGKTNQNNNFEIYNYEYDRKNGFKEDEIEAFIIANDIIAKIKNHYQVFDKNKKVLRDITFNDFSILIDRSTSFELYKKIFLYKKIPLSIYQDEYLTNSSLFLVIKSIYQLLNCLSNNYDMKKVEYAFLSIGRSFLCHYSDDELFSIIRENNYEKTEIFHKIRRILDKIEEKSISNILDEIIIEFDIYNKLRIIPSLSDNLVKIDYLYTLAKNLNEQGYTYKEFVEFLDNIITNKTDIKFSLNKEDGNSVKIMTIHKSKGLEYHICYFPGLTKKFNDCELKEKFNYTRDYGIVSPYYEEGLGNTFYHELVKQDYLMDEISEKIRLFYVALTRAKEKMIFVMPFKEQDDSYSKDGLVDKSIRASYHSFVDILESISSKVKGYFKNINVSDLKLTKDYNLINSNNLFQNIKKKEEDINVIKFIKQTKKERESHHFSKSNIQIMNQKQREIMEFGNRIHYYLETIDLKTPNLEDIDDYCKNLIIKFLNCNLMKNIRDAKIYQEYEFMETLENDEYRGIIDLMLEYSEHIDIIDYKLKNLNDDAYYKQLSGYRDYIYKITGKQVNIYLYSLMDGVYKEL